VNAFDTLEDQLRVSASRPARRFVPALAVAAALLVALVIARSGSGTVDEETVATPTPQAETPLPPDQLANFAVLRRPQSDADRAPEVDAIVKRMGKVRRSEVRVLRAKPLTLLVPVELQRGPHATLKDQLCLAVSADGKGFGSTCASLQDTLDARLRYTIPPIGIAPDFARRVKLRVRGGKTLTLTPHDNLYRAPKDAYPIQPPRWVR
jgi:hypothetical protein